MQSSTLPRGSGEAHERWRVIALWAGMLTGPIAALVLLQFNYAFAYVACESRTKWFLHVASVLAVILVAAAGTWGWRAGRGPFARESEMSPPLSPVTCESRMTWMGYTAALSSAWFIIVILAYEVPATVLKACQ